LQPSNSNLAICQCWPSSILTWISGATEVQFMQNQFFWIFDSKSYKRSRFQPKKMSYEGDMSFQRWQLNSASKQVSWRNEFKLRSEASKPISKFLFQQFSSSKSKLEYFMQCYFINIQNINWCFVSMISSDFCRWMCACDQGLFSW
jgi:hypothetical protein